MNDRICYIVGASDVLGEIRRSSADLIIAADGGADALSKIGLSCDLVIGDLDSVKELPQDVELIKFPVRKDEPDSFLAYREGVRRGYTHFRLFGGTGGREDHTYANITLAHYAAKAGHLFEIFADGYRIFAITNSEVSFPLEKGAIFSVFARDTEARGVCINGAEYNLDGASLTEDYPLGLSNAALGGEVRISVESGTLLIMVENK